MIIYYCDGFAGGRKESRRLLKKAITEYTGNAEQAERLVGELKTGEHGKPYIEGFDRFSVSHTGSIWAVLIDARECGLDIQLGKKCDINGIARRIYAPEDAERVALMAEDDPAAARDEFFRLWTRREAFAKAIGGSVYDTDLPSVAGESVTVNGKTYSLADIAFPETCCSEEACLYASVCAEGITTLPEPEFCII